MSEATNANGVTFVLTLNNPGGHSDYQLLDIVGPDGINYPQAVTSTWEGGGFDTVPGGPFQAVFSVLPGQTANIGFPDSFGTLALVEPPPAISLDVGGVATFALFNTSPIALNLDTYGGNLSVADPGGAANSLSLDAHVLYGGIFTLGAVSEAQLNQSSPFGAGLLAFEDGGGTFVLSGIDGTDLGAAGVSIIGFTDAEDVIQDDFVQFSQVGSYTVTTSTTDQTDLTGSSSSETFSFLNSAGAVLDTITVAGSAVTPGTYAANEPTGDSLLLSADSVGDLVLTVYCFLPGTRIATPGGEAAIETLHPGDLVSTNAGVRSIRRVLRRSMDVARYGHATDAYPVRVRAHALADGLPRRDLLLTGEHGVLIEGGLIPVRMLVNGGSIRRETAMSQYDYIHIDVGEHAILVAEGLETESWEGNSETTALHPECMMRSQSREEVRRAAPLVLDRERVEAVWSRLLSRAVRLAYRPSSLPRTNDDPELHLITSDGTRIAPSSWSEGRVMFRLPCPTDALRLVSRAARPDQAVGPFVDDRRLLGVKVTGLEWQNERGSGTVALPIDRPGWHRPEADGQWTNGDAALPDALASLSGGTTVTVLIASSMRYPVIRQAA